MYKGTPPTTANVLIRLGNEWHLKTVDVTSKTGSAGDSNPPFRVAIIQVSDLGNNQFDFNFVNEVGGNGTIVLPPTRSFTIGLSWPTESANLDLHIRDIANNHIYKYNAGGSYGRLLGDVQNGGDRSEVYQSNTADNIVGNYTVGVNYYSGSGPQNGNIQFIIGNQTFDKNITLIAPLGRAGDTVVPYVIGNLTIKLVDNVLVGEFIDYVHECPQSFEVYAGWDQWVDVDLHVIEPNGDNVYTYESQGTVGEMTRHLWGFENGPEIYETKCGALVPGYYDVRLNKYEGNLPTLVNVLIRLGQDYHAAKVNVTETHGYFGDSNPQYEVAIIHVIDAGNGQFNFEIVDEMGDNGNQTGNGTQPGPVETPNRTFYVSVSWPTFANNLDLYVREPWNNLINKYNKWGSFGQLFGDVLNGGDRSEIYQSFNTDQVVGNYVIGVNYYSGSGPETASFTFRIGNNTITRNLSLLAPIGRAGESVVPYIVGTLKISIVNNELVGVFEDYAPPCDASFQVYVAWDQQNSDLDLHVLEATGSHVYTMKPQGIAGKLVRYRWGSENGP